LKPIGFKVGWWRIVVKSETQPKVYKLVLYFYAKALTDMVGGMAAKAVLRHAGLLDILELEETPEPNEMIPLGSVRRLREAGVRFFGDTYVAFVRRAGRLAARDIRLPTGVEAVVRIASRFRDWRKLMVRVSERFLSPTGARVEVKYLERGYVARVYNCPECAGLSSEKPYCYFLVGFTKGIVKRLCNLDVEVKETRCIAVGDDFCEFKVTPVKQG